jgi:dUTPase
MYILTAFKNAFITIFYTFSNIFKPRYTIIFYKITDDVQDPIYISDYEIHIYNYENVTIPPGKKYFIKTGLRCDMSSNMIMSIYPIYDSMFQNMDIQINIIYPDYENEIKIPVVNNSSDPIHIKKYDAIATLICKELIVPKIYVLND